MAFTRFARIAGILALCTFSVLALASTAARAENSGFYYIRGITGGSFGDLPPHVRDEIAIANAYTPDDACNQYRAWIWYAPGDTYPHGMANYALLWYPGRDFGLITRLANSPFDNTEFERLESLQETISNCNPSGQQAATHCFLFATYTPGVMHSNPDPGLVGFEAWFWVEGIAGGYPGGNVLALNFDAGAQVSGSLWQPGWSASNPPPDIEGIWAVDSNISGAPVWLPRNLDCRLSQLGQTLDRNAPTRHGSPAGLGYGEAAARGFFQSGGWSPVTGITYLPMRGTYDRLRHTVSQYAVDPDSVTFTGKLTLDPYNWEFGDGADIQIYYADGGPGEILPPGPHTNYGFYTGAVQHTYDYHGVFPVEVRISKSLQGTISYDYHEVHYYADEWDAAPVNGNRPSGTWSGSCPPGRRYRAAPGCEVLESIQDIRWERPALSWDDQPVPPLPQIPVSACAASWATYYEHWVAGIGSTPSYDEDFGSPECSYGGWNTTRNTYDERIAWDDYHECREPGTSAAATDAVISYSAGVSRYICDAEYFWSGPVRLTDTPVDIRTMQPVKLVLDHQLLDPSYGDPREGYPVRRARPTLIPNP